MTESNPRFEQQERWLEEADRALAEAERLTGLLAVGRSSEELALATVQSEIIVLRREIERLRRGRIGYDWRNIGLEWTRLSPWGAAGP